jgi:hypothetical protein
MARYVVLVSDEIKGLPQIEKPNIASFMEKVFLLESLEINNVLSDTVDLHCGTGSLQSQSGN